MKKFKKIVCITDDGSSSIYLPELNEHYHSKYGAISESTHVFIKNGLYFWKKLNPNKKYCNIFEIGFGTGLNTFLTLKKSKLITDVNFNYFSIEAYPLEATEIIQLNYDKNSHAKDNMFKIIHESKWNLSVQMSKNFTLKKVNSEIQNYEISFKTDIIYFDPFCHRVQPELWTKKVIKPIVNSMNKSSVFVTFSSMDNLYYTLEDLKLDVEKIPGPNNKKKMIRAIKKF